MLTSLKQQILQKQNYQILDNYNNIDRSRNAKKFVSKKFCINIDFKLCENLIYYFDKDNILQLYIFKLIKEKIFKTIYNNNYYFDYYCYLAQINNLFILKLYKKIYIYIKYCSVYQINQTKYYRLYSKLISIFTKSYFFYTIVIDYIVNLFDKYNYLLTIIDKFS